MRTLSRSATIGFRWCHCNETPFSESWLMYRTCQTTLFYQDKRFGALYQTNAAARPFQGLSLFLKSIPCSQTEALTERPPDRQGTALLWRWEILAENPLEVTVQPSSAQFAFELGRFVFKYTVWRSLSSHECSAESAGFGGGRLQNN